MLPEAWGRPEVAQRRTGGVGPWSGEPDGASSGAGAAGVDGDLVPEPAAGELLEARQLLGRLHGRDEEAAAACLGEQLGLGLRRGQCGHGVGRLRQQAEVELTGEQELEERHVVEVAQLGRAEAFVVHPRHQPLGVRADHVAEQVRDRHVAVAGRIHEAQQVGADAQAARHALRLRCAHRGGEHRSLRGDA